MCKPDKYSSTTENSNKNSNLDMDKEPSSALNGEPSAVLDKEPSAVLNKEPSAVLNKEPSAVLDKEPSAVLNKEPSAVLNKEPSAVLDKAPSAVLDNKEPSAVLDNKEPSIPLSASVDIELGTEYDEGNSEFFDDDDEPATDIELAAVYWFKKMSDAEVPDEDWRAFKKWLAADEAHQTVYSELMALWDDPYFELALQEKKSALEKVDMDQVFGRESAVAAEGREATEDQVASIERKLRRLPSLPLYTALAACFMLVAFVWVIELSNPAQPQRMLYETGVGELRSVTLSDGSTVNLNTDTQLHVAFDGNARKITLAHGEAYFDVVKDGRPFLVEGGTGLVRVMGTAFEVRVSSGRMDVAVERGRVAVSPQNDEARHLELTPLRQVAVTHHRLGQIEYQDAESTIADWRDGWLEFQDRSLGEVIAELDKYYIGSISLDKRNLSYMRVTARFNIHDIRKAIKVLARSMQLETATTDTGNIVFFVPEPADDRG